MTPDIPDRAVTVDSLIAEHAAHLQQVYNDRTAGDHTFVGALANFLSAALPVLNATKDAVTTAPRDALGSIRALVAKYHERDDSLPADLVDEVYALTSAASLRGEQG